MIEFWHFWSEWLETAVGISPPVLARLIKTLVLLALFFVIRKLIARAIDARVDDGHRRYSYKQLSSYILGVLVSLSFIVIWLGGVTGLATYLGVLSAGFAIALQDPLVNLAGWFFIAIRRPFVVGDRIEIGEHAGDVIDRRLFSFSIIEIGKWVDADQSTGRVIHIPNGWVFKKSTVNFTQAFKYIWNEVPVRITFESNWVKAKESLEAIAVRHSVVHTSEEAELVKAEAAKHNIFFSALSSIVWTSVEERGVVLTVRYLCLPRRRRSTETAIWEDVLREFGGADDISFAYPTTRFYDNAAEGKAGAKGGSAGPSTGG